MNNSLIGLRTWQTSARLSVIGNFVLISRLGSATRAALQKTRAKIDFHHLESLPILLRLHALLYNNTNHLKQDGAINCSSLIPPTQLSHFQSRVFPSLFSRIQAWWCLPMTFKTDWVLSLSPSGSKNATKSLWHPIDLTAPAKKHNLPSVDTSSACLWRYIAKMISELPKEIIERGKILLLLIFSLSATCGNNISGGWPVRVVKFIDDMMKRWSKTYVLSLRRKKLSIYFRTFFCCAEVW